MPYTAEVAEAVDHYRARTIAVHVSVEARQVVLSQPEMEKLLRGAQCLALSDCECRAEQHKCEAPLETCISLDETAQRRMEQRGARMISLQEALEVLERSHRAGLVHLAYRHDGSERVEAVCSCCSCCCFFLRALKGFEYHDALAESAFVATLDADQCNGCQACVQRCQFGAWEATAEGVQFQQPRCFGCGLCVSACPTGAIDLVPR